MGEYSSWQDAKTSDQKSLLTTLENLLSIEEIEVEPALTQAANLIGRALNTEKIDVFLYQPDQKALVAFGVSDTSMGRRQKELGLNYISIQEGGRSVEVFQTGSTYLSGHVDQDSGELEGVKRALGVRSAIIVPLIINQQRQGVLQASSSREEFFSEHDTSFLQAVAYWLGLIAHRAQLTEQVELEAIQRGKRLAAEELITILAHDLMNYLTPLKARLDLLNRRALAEARERDLQDLGALYQVEQRFEHMIVDLLDVARLRKDILMLNCHTCNLVQIVKKVVETLGSPLISTETQLLEQVIIWADAERIHQLLENLLANAQEHSPQGGKVVIKLEIVPEAEGAYAQITIRDYGSGVPLALRTQLFEPFRSGENSHGLGLGLYIAKKIALAHQGNLLLDETVSDGASFVLKLPIQSMQA